MYTYAQAQALAYTPSPHTHRYTQLHIGTHRYTQVHTHTSGVAQIFYLSLCLRNLTFLTFLFVFEFGGPGPGYAALPNRRFRSPLVRRLMPLETSPTPTTAAPEGGVAGERRWDGEWMEDGERGKTSVEEFLETPSERPRQP